MLDDLLFQVLTPLNFYVRITRSYWAYIIAVKHPAMTGRDQDVQEAPQNPDEIRVSRSDPNVYLFVTTQVTGTLARIETIEWNTTRLLWRLSASHLVG